jgi:hypothetical protein
MNTQVTLGKVFLKNVSSLEINENILEMSNVANITIPRNYAKLADKPILEQFKVGDKVIITSGYNGNYVTEFTGYIREIESDFPLIIHCEDESYKLRQTTFTKSYKSATLKVILADIIPTGISWECPAVDIGKFQIDKESAFAVLTRLIKTYPINAKMFDGKLIINLKLVKSGSETHVYTIGKNVKKNELKYKRKEDFKIRLVATALNAGKKIKVVLGSLDSDTAERSINFGVDMPKVQLEKLANEWYNSRCYDGYTGSISGFGTPRTHAGDALKLIDKLEPEREGTYLIEKVDITYNDSEGFQRKNTLSYKV